MTNETLFDLLEREFTNSQYMEGGLPGEFMQDIESALLEHRAYQMLGVRGGKHEIFEGRTANYRTMSLFYSRITLGVTDKPDETPLEAVIVMYFGEVENKGDAETMIVTADVLDVGEISGPACSIDSIGLVALVENKVVIAHYIPPQLEKLPITRVWYPPGREDLGERLHPSTVVRADQDMKDQFQGYVTGAEVIDDEGKKKTISADEVVSEFTDTKTYRAVLDLVMLLTSIAQSSE